VQRQVTQTRKNEEGDITALCNPGSSWSPRLKRDAIEDITTTRHSYYVQWQEKRTDVHVARGPTGPYLRTDRDSTTRNNLDDLPDC
jgi:hypothetical protein